VIETLRDLNFTHDELCEDIHFLSVVLRWVKFVDDLSCESYRWILKLVSRVFAVEYVAIGSTADVADAFEPGSLRGWRKLWTLWGSRARWPFVLIIQSNKMARHPTIPQSDEFNNEKLN